eukprot:g12938.t1 g12938   contig7:501727-502722(-)
MANTLLESIHLPINEDLIIQLHQNHFAVIDDFLPRAFADRLLRVSDRLYSDELLRQHYFQFGGALLKKPNVYELDLSDPDRMEEVDIGLWKQVIDHVGPQFVRQMDEMDRKHQQLNHSQASPLNLDTNMPPAIKLQVNAGGGSFPWHYDNPGPTNQRSLTCVIYLNPSWNEGDGGEIVLCPFLSKPITVPPMHGRAVLFYSDRILHRVMPSNVRRVCFTMWCNGTNVNAKNDVVLSKDHLQFTSYDEAQRFFTDSPLQRVISRAVYSEEYLQSLLECLVISGRIDNDDDLVEITTEEKEKLIKQHEASVVGILTKLKPLIEEFRKRKAVVT